jgi:hypothetical protein
VDGITGEEDQKRDEAEALSLAGHDRDCAQVMLSQARLHTSPLDEIQVVHLLSIGFRAGKRAGREDAARDILDVLRQREDAAYETYARRRALGVGDQAAEWAVRSRAWRQARQAAEEAAIAVGDGVQPTEEQRARE